MKKTEIPKNLRTPVFIRLLKEINITRSLLGTYLVWMSWIPDLNKIIVNLDKELQERFEKELKTLVKAEEKDQVFQCWLQILLCRAVDAFSTYITDILEIIFKSRPELLRSSEKIEIRMVLECASLHEFTNMIAQKKVEELSYLSFVNLMNYLKDNIGLKLMADEEQLKKAIIAIADRNIIVHNHAIINERYLNNTPSTNFKLGDNLILDYDKVDIYVENLENLADHIDEIVLIKFGFDLFDELGLLNKFLGGPESH